MAVEFDEFWTPLLRAARKQRIRPIKAVLVRDCNPDNRRDDPGIQFGSRQYEIRGVRFAVVRAHFGDAWRTFTFLVVGRKDYRRLYRLARQARRDSEPVAPAPVLDPDQLKELWKNTIGYLESRNLERIKQYGGRARRGVLLTGPPGNGKTMACRWIWEQCRKRGWDWTLVTPDSYREARKEQTIKELFSVTRKGIIFFDDMDIALRDRESVTETEDQAVFLSATDGLTSNEGAVFVFTTNCALNLIDRAFKRPGRIDLVLEFKGPDSRLRAELVGRWHEDIRAHVETAEVVSSTGGFSFAEMEEIRNLLVMHFMETGVWDWSWAQRQFQINRRELASQSRTVGFTPVICNSEQSKQPCG